MAGAAPDTPLDLHATCIAIGSQGVLLRGPSGIGKSDLALRLLTGNAGHLPDGSPPPAIQLVCDDRALLTATGGAIFASPAPTLAGMLEVRGIGVLRLPFLSEVPVALVCDLVAGTEVERLPEPDRRTLIGGVSLPQLLLDPHAPSAAAQVLLAIALLNGRLIRIAT